MNIKKLEDMKKSHLIAAGFAGVIILWMLLGIVFGSSDEYERKTQSAEENSAKEIMVEVKEQQAESVIGHIVAQGHVMPDREVTLRAEAAGQVSKIYLDEGAKVKKGNTILRVEMNDRFAKLEKAKSKTTEEQSKYDGIKKLSEKGYTSKTRVDEALANLKAAQAEQEQMRLEVYKTRIRAPFEGIIDKRQVEVGDYLSVGTEIVTIVDNDPLVVAVSIPQNEIADFSKGDKAEVIMATGQKTEGKIRFVAPRAEQETRTFRVEIAIDNSENLPSGISATARIPKQSVMAHFVSQALLTLSENGVAGIKTLSEEGLVEFYQIEIISAKTNGVYVKGLPEKAKIITSGQGFVAVGEEVSFREEEQEEVDVEEVAMEKVEEKAIQEVDNENN